MCVGNIYAHSEVQSPFFMVKSPSTHHFSWLNHHQTKRHQLRNSLLWLSTLPFPAVGGPCFSVDPVHDRIEDQDIPKSKEV